MWYNIRRIKYIVIFSIIAGFCTQDVHGAQQFEMEPQYNEVNPGQEIQLTCKILNKKGQCSWQKDNKPVGMYFGKYEWAGNPDEGDCTMRILSAVLDYDDGEWECQVTASDFATQDALTSRPAKLVVRVPPNAPQVEFNGTQVPMGKNLTTQSGSRATITCRSRFGNPPPLLKWFVGNEEIVGVNQTNKTEEKDYKKWSATSVLDYTFYKEQNGKLLRCVAVHEAYPTKSRDTEVVLNIQYAPQVKVIGSQIGDLEENKTLITLRCVSDGNPPAQVNWKKSGGSQIYTFEDTLEFRPLLRKHSGTYSCEGKNYLGSAETPGVVIDVKYPPMVTGIRPEGKIIAGLYNRTVLQCQADGNPTPTYQWLQKLTTNQEAIYIRSSESMLVINNVTYDYQGKYICKAMNVISGTERTAHSSPIDLSIYGAPQILRHSVERDLAVEKGGLVTMNVLFCSNPAPLKATWKWGSLQLQAGSPMGRFKAEKIQKTNREDCYEAKFRVTEADNSDSRNYYLNVENDRGVDKYSVNLQVRDPVTMSTMIGMIGGCLILLVFVVLLILYAFKAEKWCFYQRGNLNVTDLESEKSYLDGAIEQRDQIQHHNKSLFATMPQSELQLHQHHHSGMCRQSLPKTVVVPDFHIAKDREKERSFRRRPNSAASNHGINYADLQLPATSNNGSMKKSRNQHFQQFQHRSPNHHEHQTQYQSVPIKKKDLADSQFKPSVSEQAEL